MWLPLKLFFQTPSPLFSQNALLNVTNAPDSDMSHR